MEQNTRLGAVLALVALLLGPGAAIASPQTEVVTKFNQSLLTLLAGDPDFSERLATIQPAIERTFDLEFMASKVLGSGWKKLDEAQQAQWLEAFSRLTASNYAGRFVGDEGPTFETIGEEEAARGTKVVRTKLIQPNDEDVALDYRLRETPDGWRVIDCYMNGTVSEIALRRSEYGAVLRRDGFDALLTAVNEKSDQLAAGQSN